MKYGFVKVACATPEIKVANTIYNTKETVKYIKKAQDLGVELLVFPELGLCGYTCGDLFTQRSLLNACLDALEEVREATNGVSALVFVGLPFAYHNKLYNVAAAICNGKILGLVPKINIPNYTEFYEKRYFASGKDVTGCFVDIGDERVKFDRNLIFTNKDNPLFSVGCEICEDLWVANSPSINLTQAGAKIIVNLSASDETVGKAQYRRNLVKMQSAKLVCGYLYADAGNGESTTDTVYSGHNIICENGVMLAESKLFENGLTVTELDVEKIDNERRRMSAMEDIDITQSFEVSFSFPDEPPFSLTRKFDCTPFVPKGNELFERAEAIITMQAMGLKKRLEHTHSKTAVIGISGGLDSSLALLVVNRAFEYLGWDKKNIIGITMPGFGTTGKTYNNSLKLLGSLGATKKEIKIVDSVLQHFKDIGHDPEILDVTYENSQARTRTLILMNTANKTGGIVIGTGDLSELALGWCTYNGDHMSMYAVNSSIPKTLVKYLVQHEAERLGGVAEETLLDILGTEISPELLPPDKSGNIAQKTEDLVGPYELHDFFLYYAIRWGFMPDKVLYLAQNSFTNYDYQTILKWLKNFYRRFFAQQFKRSCMPDGVKVGSVTLSPRGDWRMPSDAEAQIWMNALENIHE